MNKIAGKFMKAAVVYGLIGLALGVYMGASHDFTLMSVHSHLALIGWLTIAASAFYYQLIPKASSLQATRAHFWIANAGILIMTISLVLLSNGVDEADPVAAAGSVLSFVAFAIFVYVVFRTAHGRA
jgi:L-asparagine transporter-like permease